MKKLLISVIVIFFFSCSKNEIKLQGLFLKQEKISENKYTDYYYSNSGQLVRMEQYEYGQLHKKEYSYRNKILEESIVYVKTQEQDEYQLHGFEKFKYNADDYIIEYSFYLFSQDGEEKVSSAQFFYNQSVLDSVSYQYINIDNQQIRIAYTIDSSSNGNIIKQTRYALRNNDTYMWTSSGSYKFDNKKNPLQFHCHPLNFLDYFSSNNVIESDAHYTVYEYNNYGYPVKSTEIDKKTGQEYFSVQYIYSEL